MSKNFNVPYGPQSLSMFSANGYLSKPALIRLTGSKSSSGLKSGCKIGATLISGEGGILSHTNGSTLSGLQPDLSAFEALNADTAPIVDFPVVTDDYDLDHPTVGFSSIPDAIEDIRQGKVVI